MATLYYGGHNADMENEMKKEMELLDNVGLGDIWPKNGNQMNKDQNLDRFL